jgi:hypothetical protein
MTDRYTLDGRVAVLCHPDGWYSKHGNESMLFSPRLVDQVLKDQSSVPGLCVEWLMPGDRFRPELFRGQEVITVLILGSSPIQGSTMGNRHGDWLTA